MTEETRASSLRRAAVFGDAEVAGALLERGAKPDVADDLGWTPLLYATAAGHLPVVALLWSKGADINHAGRGGVTPLMLAAHIGHLELADLLLRSGADKSLRNELGQTAGDIALDNGASNLATLLASQPDAASMHRRLAAAAARKDVREVRRQLEAGAPASKPASTETPAIVAASCAGDIESIQLLLERGANVEETDKSGVTPLIAAALCNQLQAARVLIAAKASPSAKTQDGIDAVAAAGAKGYDDIVAILSLTEQPTIEMAVQALQRRDLKALAGIMNAAPYLYYYVDGHNKTLIQYAILSDDQSLLESLVALLSSTSFSLDGLDRGTSPLAFAIDANRLAAVKTLLRLGARPTLFISSTEATTVLDIASKRGMKEMLQVLSQDSHREILEIQSLLFTLGFLTSKPDGVWGPTTQIAWDKSKELYNAVSGKYGEEMLRHVAANYLRICNQTGTKAGFALYVSKKMYAWYDIEQGQCRWLSPVEPNVAYYVGTWHPLVGARLKLCTSNSKMDGEGDLWNKPPCQPPYRETLFVEVPDPSKPFTAH
jgi:ankyrin repeat protein